MEKLDCVRNAEVMFYKAVVSHWKLPNSQIPVWTSVLLHLKPDMIGHTPSNLISHEVNLLNPVAMMMVLWRMQQDLHGRDYSYTSLTPDQILNPVSSIHCVLNET